MSRVVYEKNVIILSENVLRIYLSDNLHATYASVSQPVVRGPVS